MPEPWERLPFEEQIRYFGEKLNVPTDSYRDISGAEHDAAFVVAGAKGAVLNDLRKAVDRAIAEGTTLEQFRKEFEDVVQRTGWAFRGNSAWRSQVVWDTNLRTSYAAGRHEQMRAVATTRPYWQWRHGGSAHPRPQHLALDGKVFRHDDPFWQSFGSPPQGYGCRCSLFTLSDRDVARRGLTVDPGPQLGDRLPIPDLPGQTTAMNPPAGWGHIHGSSTPESRARLLDNVTRRLDPAIAAQVRAEAAAFDASRRKPPLVAAAPEVVKAEMQTWIDELRAINIDDDRIMEKVLDAEYVAQEIQAKDPSRIRGLSDGQNVQAAASVFIERDAIYVEYFGKAPWSLDVYEDSRSRPEAAKVLMSQLAQESIGLGFEGRLELTPVPGAIRAYEDMGFAQGRMGRYVLLPDRAGELIQLASELSFMEYDYGDDLGPCVKDLKKLEEFKERRRAEKKAEREAAQAAQQDKANG